MRDFSLHIPTKFIFGPKVLDRAGKEIRPHALKVLIVCSSGSVIRHGILDRLLNSFTDAGIRADVYDKVTPNPKVSMIDAGGRLAQNLNVDAVIGLGGGSAMDAAKGIAIVARHGGSIWDYIAHKKTVHTSLPVISIPTLSATGSEGNAYGVVTDDDTLDKASFVCWGARPLLALIDPELTLSVPTDYVVDGAVDIISHSIEAYFTSKDHAPLNDRMSLAMVETVVETLPLIIKEPENIEHRNVLAWTATMALNNINDAGREGPWPIHALEHPLSGQFDISHGRGLAMMLPAYLSYFKGKLGDKLIRFGKCFNSEIKTDDEAISALIDWLKNIDRYLSFADLNIPETSIPDLADSVLRISGNKNNQLAGPEFMDKQHITAIYKLCLNKK